MKIGENGFCGEPCEDVFCHNHMLQMKAEGRMPFPCKVCGVGVINPELICKPCRLETKTRQRSLLLAKEFENAEPSIGSFGWHLKNQGVN